MKTTLLLILTVVAIHLSNAQSLYWQWADGAGGAERDLGNDVATDLFGNVYVTGAFSSSSIIFGNITLSNTGGTSYDYEDVFIVKYDSAGNVIWAKSAVGTTTDAGQAIATDDAGNVYVSGFFRSPSITFDALTLPLVGDYGCYNVFVVKYNSEGEAQWAKSVVTTGDGFMGCPGLASDSAGNLYLSGMFDGPDIIFDAITLTNSGPGGKTDMFVAKCDLNGNALWANNASGTKADGCYGIAVDLSGNVIAAGYFYSQQLYFGNDSLENTTGSSYSDLFIVKYDENGNVLWINQAEGNKDDAAWDVATDHQNNIYLTGEFFSGQISFDTITVNNSQSGGYGDMFLAKYNASGNILWIRKAICESEDNSYGVATDPYDGVYISGSFEHAITFDTIDLEISGFSPDIFLAKYDTSGNFKWVAHAPGASADYSYAVAADKKGNAFITGQFLSDSLHFGNISVPNSSSLSYDMFIARYGSDCAAVFYFDADGDEYGNNEVTLVACDPPEGYVATGTDCDDNSAGIYPGAVEIPNNGIDEDCDGADKVVTWIQSMQDEHPLLQLYPNPVTKQFTVELSLNEIVHQVATIEIRDLFGRKVYADEVSITGNTLKKVVVLDDWMVEGIYLVKLYINDWTYLQQFAYQK